MYSLLKPQKTLLFKKLTVMKVDDILKNWKDGIINERNLHDR